MKVRNLRVLDDDLVAAATENFSLKRSIAEIRNRGLK